MLSEPGQHRGTSTPWSQEGQTVGWWDPAGPGRSVSTQERVSAWKAERVLERMVWPLPKVLNVLCAWETVRPQTC